MARLARIPESVRKSPDDFLHCHLLGHNWDDHPTDDWHPDSETLIDRPLSFRCVYCGTVRREVVKRRTGELISRQYSYPDNYSVGKVDFGTRTRKETFRAEYLERRI